MPLGEIRQLQNGNLTLNDCLNRHLITLNRRAENLEAMQSFCRQLLEKDIKDLKTLSMEQLFQEMQSMEEGGTKFVDIKKRDRKKRKQGALIGAFSFILLMVLFLGIVIWGIATDSSFPMPLALLLLPIPLLVIFSVLYALKERFKEIEGGELDEASKY